MTESAKPPPRSADRGAARLLRGGRSRDPDRRAGDREIRRAGLCPPRDRPQQVRRRQPQGQGRGVRRGARSGAPMRRRWSSRHTACPRRCRVTPPSAGLSYLDATCPLVSKVHRQAERLVAAGKHILFIGHAGHPEVIGTFGQVPAGTMTLVETVGDARAVAPPDPGNLAFLTQTTLSVDDTAAVLAVLRQRFPAILAPAADDICYATLEPPGGGQGDRAALRPGAGDRRAQFVQFAAAGRGGRASRHPPRTSSSAPATWISPGWRGVRTLGITPAPRRPKCWCASWSTASPSAST